MSSLPLNAISLSIRETRGVQHRSGFTLVELVVSLGIMSVILAGVSSAILVASHALPSPTSAMRRRSEVVAALDRISAELECATAITELTSTAVTFTVADRGHGAAGAETIRYIWTGVSGGDLVRQYNGGLLEKVATGVTSFALSSTVTLGSLKDPPRVLMFVDSLVRTSDDDARIAKLTEWTFPVTTLPANALQSQFNAAIASCDVVYAPGGVKWLSLASLFDNPAVGIVIENDALYGVVGISTAQSYKSDDKIEILNDRHPITEGMPLGDTIITTSDQALHLTAGTLAPGAQVLADKAGGGGIEPALVLIDDGAMMSDGRAARARRVAMPWGGDALGLFSYQALNGRARTLLKRSLVWAAAPKVYDTVSVRLTAGMGTGAEITVDLLNQPGVPKP